MEHPCTPPSWEDMASKADSPWWRKGLQEVPAQQKVCAGGHSDKVKCENPPLKPAALLSDKLETRLLTVCSGEFNDSIRCRLSPVSLKDSLSYIALSYFWGNADERGEINVNGQDICVTKSLEIALRYMRKIQEDVVVWADAICINQADSDEKQYQIGMMGNIYANASRGWVWLGESADNSDSAMDLVNSISKIDFDDSGHELDQDAWTALKRLFQRPWWGRLWVVQESLLAQKVAMNCGTKVVGIENFVQLKEIEQKYRRRPEARLRPMQVGLTSPFGTILSDWKRHKDMIAKGGIPLFEVLSITGECECKDPVDKIFGLLSMCTAEDRQAIRVDCKLKARDLVIMVAKYHFRQRERYSPLKILQTHQAKKDPTLPSWVPDYTKDDFENHFMFPASKDSTPFTAGANNAAWNALASEFHDTPVVTFIAGVSDASKVLKTLWLGPLFIFGGLLWIWRLADQTLQAIRQVSQVLTSPAGGSLLSRAMRSANIMTDTANRLSKTVISALISLLMRNALNSVALRIEDEGLHETLVLPGLVVDNVSDAFPAPDVEFYKGSDMGEDANRKRHRREEMKEACKTWENNVLNLPPGTDPYRKTCGRYDAFWRTVIADRDYTWKGPPPAEWDFAGRFEAWLGRREDRADDEPYFRPFSDAAVIHCLNRSFIVTERGYLGLGRVSTKQGDIVCVLRGGNVPFILRRKGYGYYELVGEAYVHGIMDGTFVRNARKEELKEFRIR